MIKQVDMKYTLIIVAGLGLAGMWLVAGCGTAKNSTTGNSVREVNEKTWSRSIDTLTPGIRVFEAAEIDYRRDGKKALHIQFREPVTVSVASRPEKWGYFQFPSIEKKDDHTIRTRWNLNDDAMEAYGSHKFGEAISKDGGRTWQPVPYSGPMADVVLSNGERLAIHTPKPIKVSDITLPARLGGSRDTYSNSTTNYYKMQDLPEIAQAIYFDRKGQHDTAWKTEKATLTDPRAARYTLRGNLPIIWWGDLRKAADGSIIAGVYPGFYVKDDGKADSFHHVFFYRSTDAGRSWNVRGRVFYEVDTAVDKRAAKRMGFTEPAYEVLADGTMININRTTDGVGNGPMFISRSTDQGITWSKPEFFMASGVLPRLLQLQNGVTVLSTGRPGVQLRFSNDGEGKVWSNAFEMMPWIDYRDQVSCGYTGLVATGPDRFIIVYSDFRFVQETGEVRKAIKVKEVIVTPQ
jgi:hypothetical protein